jgi:uncharacterized membrane protein
MLKKIFTVALGIIVILAIGSIVYLFKQPIDVERFTEFYLLDLNGTAINYPIYFKMNPASSNLSSSPLYFDIQYGSNSLPIPDGWGRVRLGIINHEHNHMNYKITMQIDGVTVKFPFNGEIVDKIGPINLSPEEKWEREIGILPQHKGEHQKVEFYLFKNSELKPNLDLSLWIDIR